MQTTPHEFRSFEPSSSNYNASVVPPGSRLAQYMGALPQQSSNTSSPRHTSTGWPPLGSQPQPLYSQHTRSHPNHLNSMMQSFGHLSVANNGVKTSTRTFPSLPTNGGSPPEAESVEPASSFVQESFGGTTYFLPRSQQGESNSSGPAAPNGGESYMNASTDYLSHSGCFMYQGPLSFTQKLHRKNGPTSFFVNNDLRTDLLKAQLAVQNRADSSTLHDIPTTVEHYQYLTPMRPTQSTSGVLNGEAACTTYKAVSIKDGMPYVLKKAKYRPLHQKHVASVDCWKNKILQSNIIALREMFTTQAFNDTSLVFVYDYHPLAESLENKHLVRTSNSPVNGGVTESVIWSYIIQLTGALRTIHHAGLAARTISIEKVLVVGRQKILLSDCATTDLMNDTNIAAAQLEDLVSLGRLVLCLAVGSSSAAKRECINPSLAIVTNNYSADLKNLINYLLTQQSIRKSVNDLMPMIGARFYQQLETAQMHNDNLENELSKELENGRLFRLLCKINSIVERPELNMDATWSETGDRFLLKLFRDYLFHQVNEQGKPWMDLAHVVSSLNKLDAGVQEKVQLVSRDAENVLIVSYADLRRCFDVAFKELVAQQTGNDGYTGSV